MLIRVKVENFKSFDDREVFSMLASKKIRTSEKFRGHCASVGKTRLLKNAAVYGANSAGKTNLISVFSFIKFALRHFDPDIERPLVCEDYCRNRLSNSARESYFEIQFTVGRVLYAYGFTILLSEGRITGEWLNVLLPGGDAKPLFERKGGKAPVLKSGVRLDPGSSDAVRFGTYSSDFDGNDSRLFLSEMNSGKSYDPGSGLLFFKQTYDWITQNMIIISPNTAITPLLVLYDEKYLGKIAGVLGSFDTGITGIRKKAFTIEELKRRIPSQILDDVFRRLRAAPGRQSVCRYLSDMYIMYADSEGREYVDELVFSHENSESDFAVSEESAGTRRILDLVDILITVRPDVVYMVDELDRSLHPNLTRHFLKAFIDTYGEEDAQLIITTHESAIMNRDMFRRDEIWFVERDGNNSSVIYSLDSYMNTRDSMREKLYLDGRYGAVPTLR